MVRAVVDDHGRKLHMGHGYSCHVCVLRPKSRGSVWLKSADPTAPPAIDPAFLKDERDMETLVRGAKMMTKRIFARGQTHNITPSVHAKWAMMIWPLWMIDYAFTAWKDYVSWMRLSCQMFY